MLWVSVGVDLLCFGVGLVLVMNCVFVYVGLIFVDFDFIEFNEVFVV